MERIKDPHGPFQRDSEVFVALVARYLRFMHTEPPRQFPLRNSLGDPQRDQQLSQSAEVVQVLELSPPCSQNGYMLE